LENWVDIFELLPRPQLVELLFQTDDRKFAKCIHFFLNKCGKITLADELHIKSSKNASSTTAVVQKMKQEWLLADVPMPMPNNIKDFHRIQIRFDCFIGKVSWYTLLYAFGFWPSWV
jgi:hypothetical protein